MFNFCAVARFSFNTLCSCIFTCSSSREWDYVFLNADKYFSQLLLTIALSRGKTCTPCFCPRAGLGRSWFSNLPAFPDHFKIAFSVSLTWMFTANSAYWVKERNRVLLSFGSWGSYRFPHCATRILWTAWCFFFLTCKFAFDESIACLLQDILYAFHVGCRVKKRCVPVPRAYCSNQLKKLVCYLNFS